MKAKTKFLKMFYKLPVEARRKLVYDFTTNPMSLNVCCIEIRNDTKLGKEILDKLGFKNPNTKEGR